MRKLTVSVSEIQLFEKCRRRWLLSREWEKPTSAPALWFGDGIHKALEAYNNLKLKNNEATDADLIAVMASAFEQWSIKQRDKLAKEFGMLWDQGQIAFENMVDIGWKMLLNYVEYDRDASVQFRPLLVERLIWIPMGDNDYLSMKMDLIAESDGGIGPVDNKTSAGRHSAGQMLDIDEQMTSYAMGFWKITNQIPDFIAYNVLAKEVPSEPKILKSGALSTDKQQKTTHRLYSAAIQENGLDPADYEEMLDLLEAKGWDGFFERELSPRSLAQIKNQERRTKILFTEMRRCLETPELAYPSFSPMNCPSCPFLSVCSAMEAEDDVDYLLGTSYKRKVDSPWKKRRHDLERNK